MLGRCCVFQPFDKGGPHDRRYTEIIEPAIIEADLDPYRVDKDHGAPIPIDALHKEIRAAVACLADISTLNPNVMYELGAAIHGEKPVVIISSAESATFPFDIRHRKIIQYKKDSPSDFDFLKTEIRDRLLALIKTEVSIEGIVTASPVKPTHGLRPQEIVALSLVMTGGNDHLTEESIRRQMQRAGYTNFATALALTTLKRAELIRFAEVHNSYNNDEYFVCYLTEKGEDWLIANQDGLETRIAPEPSKPNPALPPLSAGIDEDDVPF